MKTESIILKGPFASGKTFLIRTISSFLEPEKVLKINPDRTIVGMIRDIHSTNNKEFDLIIFDGCFDQKHINSIDKRLIKNYFEKNGFFVKKVIYTTQNEKPTKNKNFKIIHCFYKN